MMIKITYTFDQRQNHSPNYRYIDVCLKKVVI